MLSENLLDSLNLILANYFQLSGKLISIQKAVGAVKVLKRNLILISIFFHIYLV